MQDGRPPDGVEEPAQRVDDLGERYRRNRVEAREWGDTAVQYTADHRFIHLDDHLGTQSAGHLVGQFPKTLGSRAGDIGPGTPITKHLVPVRQLHGCREGERAARLDLESAARADESGTVPQFFHRIEIDRIIDASAGMSDADRDLLLDKGIGITNVVARATATAAELTSDELRAGGRRLRETVRNVAPVVVAVAGITAYRTAFGKPKAVPGRQGEQWDGAELWVVPNPSGLNAHETVDSLAAQYARAAAAAGVAQAEF